MKIYNIVGGVNGAGKSSLTGSLKYQRDDLGTIVDVDRMTAEQYNGDEYEGGKAAVAKIEQCIKAGVNFTQESTLAGSYVRKVAQAAKEAGYYIRLFYVGIDTVEEALRRIQNRVEKGGHGIPKEDVKRRFGRQIGALAQVLPYCNEAVFFDNRNGFAQVAEYRNGEVIPMGNGNRPAWLDELLRAGGTNTGGDVNGH